MDINEINRIGGEAAADEAEQHQDAPAAPGLVNLPGVAEQFADFLDMAAKVAGHGLNVPTIPQRFTHEANIDIATAAVKLCNKYGIDAQALLLGEDSTVGAWLGLVVAVGLPGYAVYNDIKLAKAKEVQAAAQRDAANDGEKQQQQG